MVSGTLETQLREMIRTQGKADSTAEAYWFWCQRFILFLRANFGSWVHPKDAGERDVERWLKSLAVVDDVSANTQNQAFSAVCYLYRHVLRRPLVDVSALRAKRPDRVRDVLDQSELVQLFQRLSGIPLLAARMMYASGVRIGELGKLRIKDISFERQQMVVRGGKGEKDRKVKFPLALHVPVRRQIESMRLLWESDLDQGLNGVSLPHAFGRKSPRAHMEFAWWYLFTSSDYSRDPISGRLYRHHFDTGNIARRIKLAAIECGFDKRVTSHCLRHSFATHSLESGVPIHFVQQLLGHADITTTERYLHASVNGATSAPSPLEHLLANPTQSDTRIQQPERSRSDQSAPRLRVFAG
jgi:integron integrase